MIRSLAALSLLAIACSPVAFGQSSGSFAVSRTAPLPPQRSASSSACSPDRRTDPNAGVVISEVVFEGTIVSSSGEISTIKSQIIGACFDEQSDIIASAIRNAFADQGFAQADVENVTLKASDTLALPKPVTLEADISEGLRFRFGAITFIGNHAFSDAKLRAAFPITKGDLFRRAQIANGLSGIRNVYAHKGYQDLTFAPNVSFSSTDTVDLTITISEGTQYHMGELKIYAKKDVSDRLAGEWHLREGAIFDGDYPKTFLDKSHSLPPEFGRQNIVLVRNCPEASIAVLLIVDQTDPGLQTPPKEVQCKKPDDSE